MRPSDIVSFAFWIWIMGWLVYTFFFKKGANRKKAATGEDLERVQRAVRDLLPPDAQDAGIAYAHWEDVTHSGRTTRTTYYRYAVAFKSETSWIFPLNIDKATHEVEVCMPWVLTPEKLGKILVTRTDKNGEVRKVEAWYADKQGDTIVRINVDAENLNSSKYLPVNIVQEPEVMAFDRFLSPLALKVAQENPQVEELIAQKSAGGLAGIAVGLAVGGFVGGIFFPPLGAILCVAALVMAINGKRKGNPGNKALITSIVCLALMIAWSAIIFSMGVF